jgi:hypothetical protein
MLIKENASNQHPKTDENSPFHPFRVWRTASKTWKCASVRASVFWEEQPSALRNLRWL